jgi:Na+/proline symporter
MWDSSYLLAAGGTKIVEKIDLGATGVFWLGTALALYMLMLFVLSLFASKNVQNEEDFLVAGRRLGLFLCWGSLIATWFGAASMTGAAQAAREEGVRGTILDPWACSFTLIIAGLFYAGPLWRMKLLTTGDFFRRVYGPRSELICSGVQIPSYFGWIAGQYLALAAVQQAYFGVPEGWGVVIGFAIALVYTMVGGMWSVTLTDTVQIVIAFIGLIILGHATLSAFGGGEFSTGLSRLWNESSPDALTMMPPVDASWAVVLAWCGTWATGLFGNIPGQDLQQRMFSARSARTAQWACLWAGILYLAFGMIPVGLGLMSRIEFPPESTALKVKVLMYMAGQYLSVPLAIIFVVSFVSIVMSTACSAVLAPATILGHNFLGRLTVFQNNRLRLERACVFIISLGGLAFAFSGESVRDLLDFSLSVALVGLFVPLTFGIYGRPRGELPAIISTLAGVVVFFARSIPEMYIWPLPEGSELEWFQYVEQLSGSRVLGQLMIVPPDVYGTFVSLIGYCIGQVIEKRRGVQWNPNALLPPTIGQQH